MRKGMSLRDQAGVKVQTLACAFFSTKHTQHKLNMQAQHAKLNMPPYATPAAGGRRVEAVDDVAALARVDHVKDALVVVWGIVLYSERARVSTGMPVR